MSDESDIDVMSFVSRKGKRSSRIEDSGSSSDSPVEQRKKRKRVLVSNFCNLQFGICTFYCSEQVCH
jgi:hypothetical protein